MSNFYLRTKNPWTGEWEVAEWLDDHFGRHRYGVRFGNGDVIDPEKIELEVKE